MMNQTKQADKKIKICFASMGAYPLLSGEKPENILGPDVHQVLLAKELVKYNFNVTFITPNERGVPIEYINGIEIINIRIGNYCISKINTILNVFHIWNTIRKAKADIYFQRGGFGGLTPLFCRLYRKRFVASIASDAYVDKEIKDWGILFRLSSTLEIKLADIVIVQSEFQRTMLKKNFAKDGLLIKEPFPLTTREMPEKVKPPIVLWVGSIAEVKQPELFLKLAEITPEAKFQMIAGRGDNDNYYRRIEETSKSIPNLNFLGPIPFNAINKYFNGASILVNNSKFEGFPGAFIQAWMSYVPVVSLNSDPDEIICSYKLGFHSKTFQQLKEDVKTLLKDEQLREEMGKNGRQYVEREHDIINITEEYIKVFNQERRV